MKVNLTVRQQHILQATVRSYVVTAEPVGSKTLAQTYDLGVSTATIRNVMALLERNGLLYQPHTSAGRIPSDSGYRVYVDNLLDECTDLQRQFMQALSERLGSQLNENLETLLHTAAQILATLSGCLALITAPPADTAMIRHLQLVPVDDQRIMAILVTDSYQTHSVLLNLQSGGQPSGLGFPLSQSQMSATRNADSPAAIHPAAYSVSDAQTKAVSEDELQLLNNFLNVQLRGKTFFDILNIDWTELDRQFRSYSTWLRQLLEVLKQSYLQPTIGQVYVGGVTGLLRQPEFTQSEHIQAVVGLLEANQTALWPVLEHDTPGKVVMLIGSENPLEPMRQCTLISTSYTCGSWSLGSVGLLGPTRMPYEQAIASVKATAQHLSHTLNQAYA
jgi:heat-inducible transcriptional repressor